MYHPPNNVPQANWTFTVTNRLLIEAGATARIFSYVNDPQPGVTRDTISVLEQSNGLRYRAAATYGGNATISYSLVEPSMESGRRYCSKAFSRVSTSLRFSAL